MPYTAPPAPFTSIWWNANVKDQVVTTCTSATRPTGTQGQVIYETDTGRVLCYEGGAWVRVSHASTAGRTGAVLRRAANQSIANTTDTAISWDTEDTDTDGFIAVTASTLTIPSGMDGIYGVSASVAWASSPGANSNVRIALTGTTGDYRTSVGTSTVAFQNQAVSAVVALAATNTIAINCYQSTGGAINVTARLEVWRLCR